MRAATRSRVLIDSVPSFGWNSRSAPSSVNPPAKTEIARAFGFKGVRGAQYHLEALEAAGAIERKPGVARSLRVLKAPAAPQLDMPLEQPLPDDAVRLPILGQVAAGLPIGADVDAFSESYAVLDRAFFSPRPDYLLKVKGDSMIDEGIFCLLYTSPSPRD